MSKVRPMPCEACPYRRDVPSGLWAEHEYDKLRDYDKPTMEQFDDGDGGQRPRQPFGSFYCHASPEALCNGWAVCHTNRGDENYLLALRLWHKDVVIPQEVVPLFASGNEAADHGIADIEAPTEEAVEAQSKLLRKHPRLLERWEEMSELEEAEA